MYNEREKKKIGDIFIIIRLGSSYFKKSGRSKCLWVFMLFL